MKKGQEEIVGFAVIVIIVSVILVVFLGIFLSKNDLDRNKESIEIFHFLDSVMSYTSECAIGYEPNFLDFGNLIRECYSGISICVSGKNPCEVFSETLDKIVAESFSIREESFYKGYEFTAVFSRNSSVEEEVVSFSEGNCSQRFRGSELPLSVSQGVIRNSLKLCF